MIRTSRAQTGAALPNPAWGTRGTALLPAALSDTGAGCAKGFTIPGTAERHHLHPCLLHHPGKERWRLGLHRDGNDAADGREQAEVEALSC